MIISGEQMIRDVAHQRAQAVIRQFRTAIRPIYRTAPRSLLTHVGTCTLFRIGDAKLIVTAAHIVDQHKEELWVGGEKTAVSLTGAFRGTPTLNGLRELDKYDFSVSPVSDELAAALGNTGYIDDEFISKGRREDRKHAMYVCVGFPNSQNKEADATRREMNVRLWMHTSRGRSNHAKLGKWARETRDHLFIDFAKYANRVDGSKKTSTHPRGTSGGPVFYLGDFGDPNTFRPDAKFQARFEGVIIEKPRQSNVLVAVKIGAVIQALQNAGL